MKGTIRRENLPKPGLIYHRLKVCQENAGTKRAKRGHTIFVDFSSNVWYLGIPSLKHIFQGGVMPRSYRIVLSNYPHHIVQRGNRRQKVFFNDIDRRYYLKLLRLHAKKHAVRILAYCLMDNHVHLILIPETPNGLAKALAEVHRSYTKMINLRYGWRGYLWQGRFGSFPIGGESYLLRALRYVERNPVRAGMCSRAEDYPWSSAATHTTGKRNAMLSTCPDILSKADWRYFINTTEPAEALDVIRRTHRKGIPFGDETLAWKISCEKTIPFQNLLLRPVGRQNGISEQSHKSEQK
ncbi:MAG: transposase [Candidatus Omnitrophica bacterium]|nr:transposase [Candidatus Omnitrophota bacterium]